MLTEAHNAGSIGRAAIAAAAILLCVSAAWAHGQHSGASAPHSAPSVQPARPLGNAPRPAYPGPPFMGPGVHRPAYPGYAPPVQGPPGHLGDWLNQHRNLPVQEQERMLRADPNFRRLPPAEQQRVVQQLHQVNQLSEEQRQRRLARAEMIEHLPPQERHWGRMLAMAVLGALGTAALLLIGRMVFRP